MLVLVLWVVVVYEWNSEINARLEAVGIEVVVIVGSEFGSGCGGLRCMFCSIVCELVLV